MLTDLTKLLGQTDPASGWGEIVATYGPFAPFAVLLLWLLQLLWKDNKEKESEIRALTNMMMEKVLPLIMEATNVLGDAVTLMQALKNQGQDVNRMNVLMNDLMDSLDHVRRALEDKRS